MDVRFFYFKKFTFKIFKSLIGQNLFFHKYAKSIQALYLKNQSIV